MHPRVRELPCGDERIGLVPRKRSEHQEQSVQRARVAWVAFEVVAEDPTRLVGEPRLEERGPERLAHGIEPVRRFVVAQGVLGGNRASPRGDRAVDVGRETCVEHGVHHGGHRAGGVVEPRCVGRKGLLGGGVRLTLLHRFGLRSLFCERHRPAEPCDDRQDRELWIGQRQRQGLVPLREPQEHPHFLCREGLEHRHVGQPLGDVLHHVIGRLAGLRELARHHRRRRQKIQIVVVVHRRIHAARVRVGDVLAIDLCRLGVGRDGPGVVAGPHVDMRRHVDEVTRGRHQRLEAFGAGERPLRRVRRFDGVDVVVVGAHVARAALQHRLEHVHDLQRPFGRRTVVRPELPGTQVHQALGVQRGGVEIVRIPPDEIAHRVLVLDRQRFQIRLGIVRITLDDRLDVGALCRRRRRRERQRPLRGVVRVLLPGRVDVEVDVWTERQRDAPERHRRGWIEQSGAPERADGFVVVECIHKRQALIEELLGVLALGGDRVMRVAETGHERRGAAGGLIVRGLAGEECEQEEQKRHDCSPRTSPAYFSSSIFRE